MYISINGISCEATEGESILQIARKNEIYIPALCYLNGASPTLACRLCMVEADGKRVYACNAKPKEGMKVFSDLDELWAERNAIMQTYCINHPLQCGVCDKSGECELQNMTLRSKVNEQKHFIKDTHKPHKKWGLINYDPALCIVCERCITVCKDKIGESALKTVPRGSEPIASDFKEKMSKDSFFVWNKFQKNLIGPAAGESLDCSFCGECTSVCPTGALINADFKYSSNAWELLKIPAANPHSSDCEAFFYDIKYTSVDDNNKKIYRVSNDFHFTSLNRATRFGFKIQNEVEYKDEQAFNKLLQNFKECKNIRFNSYITNEEAYILSLLAKKYDMKLVNEEARSFQSFIKSFTEQAGSLYEGTSSFINESDFLISIGSMLRYDAPNLSYKVNNALIMNKASLLYVHPIQEKGMNYNKNVMQINPSYKKSEELLLFILEHFAKDLPEPLKSTLSKLKYTKTKEIEESISEEIIELIKDENGEEKEQKKTITKKVKKNIDIQASSLAKALGLDEEELDKLLLKKSKFSLIVGSDFYSFKKADKLARLLALIQKYTSFKLFFIPPATNSLGVSLLCDLEEEVEGKSFGYNEKADFSFSYEEGSDLLACGLNQQEGSFTNYDFRLVPTNAALSFKGYFLNDFANALGLKAKYTIDYTKDLPENKGYRLIAFDDLKQGFRNDGSELRGYLLAKEKIKIASLEKDDFSYEEAKNIELLENELEVYDTNPIHQFSKLSNRAFAEVASLFLSPDLMAKFELKDKDAVILYNKDYELALSVKEDANIKAFAYLPNFDSLINTKPFFTEGPFAKLALRRVK